MRMVVDNLWEGKGNGEEVKGETNNKQWGEKQQYGGGRGVAHVVFVGHLTFFPVWIS
jgi:hypothetical protein